jgi:hypothetical protein
MTTIDIGLTVLGLATVVFGVMAIVMILLLSWSAIQDLIELEKDRKRRNEKHEGGHHDRY